MLNGIPHNFKKIKMEIKTKVQNKEKYYFFKLYSIIFFTRIWEVVTDAVYSTNLGFQLLNAHLHEALAINMSCNWFGSLFSVFMANYLQGLWEPWDICLCNYYYLG
jgi:hypothetical protein